jgi:hypothetical protein
MKSKKGVNGLERALKKSSSSHSANCEAVKYVIVDRDKKNTPHSNVIECSYIHHSSNILKKSV